MKGVSVVPRRADQYCCAVSWRRQSLSEWVTFFLTTAAVLFPLLANSTMLTSTLASLSCGERRKRRAANPPTAKGAMTSARRREVDAGNTSSILDWQAFDHVFGEVDALQSNRMGTVIGALHVQAFG